ncbi:hypothetical protein C7381_10221, partial [Ezakiella coagulans]
AYLSTNSIAILKFHMEICGREERPDLMNMNMILRLVRYVDYSILTVANRVMVLVTKCIEKKLGLK